jgi:hypothetical protein
VSSSSLSGTLHPSPSEQTTCAREERPNYDVRKAASFLKRKSGFSRHHNNSKATAKGPLGLRCLFSATKPLVDLVFVHGIRDGSIKTWRYGDDQQLFWPQYWLPKEPELANASIHSLGYESHWGSMKPSILDVHDFGRSLFEELLTSPLLRHTSKVHVRHSSKIVFASELTSLEHSNYTDWSLHGWACDHESQYIQTITSNCS